MTLETKNETIEACWSDGVAFLRRGSGCERPVFAFLHGIGSDAASWRGVLDALQPDGSAIAWNAPGYRNSRPLARRRPSPSHYAGALAQLFDRLDVKSATIVGHSLGCLFAAAFAQAHPERTDGLVLLSPALGYQLREGDPLPAPLQTRIDDFTRMGPRDFARRAAPRLIFRPETKTHLVEAVEATMAAVHPDYYIDAAHALGVGDLIADAQTYSGPTLVGVGAEDVVTPVGNAIRLHAAMQDADPLFVVPRAGHALPQEDPLAVAQRLARFAKERVHGGR